MLKKSEFIDFINEEIFSDEAKFVDVYKEKWVEIKEYWEKFCQDKPVKAPTEITETGIKLLKWLQNAEVSSYTAKEIGENISMNSRAVSGAMRKLVIEGFVEKTADSPVKYKITEKGMNYNIASVAEGENVNA